VEAALEALGLEGTAAGRSLSAAVHELALGALALMEARPLPLLHLPSRPADARLLPQQLVSLRIKVNDDCLLSLNEVAFKVQEAGPPVAIAALQTLMERASLAATGRCAAVLAADVAALADLEDWDEPPPRLLDGAPLRP